MRISDWSSDVCSSDLIALEDGSIVTLNGNSAVQIRYEDDIRRVVLRRGEASFEVAHNSERPFVVSADGVKVRAVGTEFVVGIEDEIGRASCRERVCQYV